MPAPQPFNIAFDLPFTDAIAASRSRGVMLPDKFYGELQSGANQVAFTISTIQSLDTIQRVLDSLTLATQKGQSFEEWQHNVVDDIGQLPEARQELIFRNAVQTAYSIGQTTRQEEDADQRPYLMWDAINDDRTRPTHRAMDGHIAPINDPIWLIWSPPAGHNCRCSRISLTAREAHARGYPMWAPAGINPDPGFAYDKASVLHFVNLQNALHDAASLLPQPIRSVVANVEQAMAERQRAIEWTATSGVADGHDIEFCEVVAPDGYVLTKRRGGISTVVHTNPEIALYRQNPGSYYIHNHPGSGSLSDNDLSFAIQTQMGSMTAIGNEMGLYEATGLADVSSMSTVETYRAVDATIRAHLIPVIRRGMLDPDLANAVHWHIVNAATAKRVGYTYRAILSKPQAAALIEVTPFLANTLGVANSFDAVVEALAREVDRQLI